MVRSDNYYCNKINRYITFYLIRKDISFYCNRRRKMLELIKNVYVLWISLRPLLWMNGLQIIYSNQIHVRINGETKI